MRLSYLSIGGRQRPGSRPRALLVLARLLQRLHSNRTDKSLSDTDARRIRRRSDRATNHLILQLRWNLHRLDQSKADRRYRAARRNALRGRSRPYANAYTWFAANED